MAMVKFYSQGLFHNQQSKLPYSPLILVKKHSRYVIQTTNATKKMVHVPLFPFNET